MMELCSGYLLFAGIFLLNDPVTAPRHWLGRLLYGAFAGILVMALRYFGGLRTRPVSPSCWSMPLHRYWIAGPGGWYIL